MSIKFANVGFNYQKNKYSLPESTGGVLGRVPVTQRVKPLTSYQHRRLAQLLGAEKLNRQQKAELVRLRKGLLPHQREILRKLESGELTYVVGN